MKYEGSYRQLKSTANNDTTVLDFLSVVIMMAISQRVHGSTSGF